MMKNMRKMFKKEEVLEILKKGSFGSQKFRKAVERAYMSENIVKYVIGKNVHFEQGSGREAIVPYDIVEDIIGTNLDLPRRAA